MSWVSNILNIGCECAEGEIFAVNESVGRMTDFKHANVPRFIHDTPTRSSNPLLEPRFYCVSRRPACWPHASSYVDLEPPRACRCLVCGRVLTSQTETHTCKIAHHGWSTPCPDVDVAPRSDTRVEVVWCSGAGVGAARGGGL